MYCDRARELLSIYHDGELPSDQRAALEVHLESCSRCSKELAEFRRLSELTSKLDAPQYSHDDTIEPAGQGRAHLPVSKRRPSTTITILSVAATIIIAFVIGTRWHREHGHVDLAQYWHAFRADPLQVQTRFVARHAGHVVSADEAELEVGYRPLVASQTPALVHIETSYVLHMPCCHCIETICRRADGTALAVFEHREKQPRWFPGRPQVKIRCADTACQVTELDRDLAASWSIGSHVVTVVGLRDIDELTRWVQTLAERRSPGQSARAS